MGVGEMKIYLANGNIHNGFLVSEKEVWWVTRGSASNYVWQKKRKLGEEEAHKLINFILSHPEKWRTE